MGSTKWNKEKAVQCSVCNMWVSSNSDKKTPSHKPKGDVLSIKDCVGTGKSPSRTKGFEGKVSPYNAERPDRYKKKK